MCGRFTLKSRPSAVAVALGLDEVPEDLGPRYNIAPGQDVPVVRIDPETGRRVLAMLRWGLIPSWANDPSIGHTMINARVETVAEKPSFRSAYKRRRCLVVADGFYEWSQGPGGKVPHHFRFKDGSPFGFAGLWERWEKGDAPVESVTIITVPANDVVGPVHHRMPAIVEPSRQAAWLDPEESRPAVLLECLARPHEALMEGFPVCPLVNNARNQGPSLIDPASPGP